MTNAQNATWHAVKEIVAQVPNNDIYIQKEPEPLHNAPNASVTFYLRAMDVELRFLIEAGGCLARIYA